MSCQNETWNAGHDECKHESRSATNFSGKSSKETRKYGLCGRASMMYGGAHEAPCL